LILKKRAPGKHGIAVLAGGKILRTWLIAVSLAAAIGY
jgi:hypothetical protein